MFQKGRSAALGFIFVTVLIDVIGFGIIIPVLPKLIQDLTGGDMSEASRYGGWLMFTYAFMQFLFAPILGNLSDRYGRRSIILISLFGFGLDYLLLAWAPTITWLFIARILSGITGASITTASAYIADISTPEKRAQNFGMIGAAFGLGFIIGPFIGGVLGQYGDRIPFLFAAGLTLVNWLYGMFILPESLPADKRRKFEWSKANPVGSLLHLKKYPAVAGLIISLTLIYIGAHAVQSTWSYYTMEKFKWNSAMVGYSLAFVGLMIAIVQGGLIRVVIPKLGQSKSLFTGLVMYTIGMVCFAFAGSTAFMFASCFVYCLGGIAGPALQGIISSHVPSNEQGELQGALTSLMSATSIVGPPLMTNLFSFFSQTGGQVYFPGAPFIAGAIFFLISTIITFRSLQAEKKTVPF
ncbi:MAG: TCR/Tet family MFS transporter [Chitinophagaceae bacterium]|jgi:DHA1 family tetracycline resistance protein-like MFS transporter